MTFDFPAVSSDAWRAALQKELGDRPLDRLTWQIGPDVSLPPFVRADDLAEHAPLLRRVAALLPDHAPALVPWTDALEIAPAKAETLEETGANVVEMLAALVAHGVPDELTVPVGPNVLLGAATLRALRLLAARVRTDAGQSTDVHIQAVTSRFWMTRAAPHTNLLRATLGAAAAFLGRADALTVRPHDLLTGATPHGQRIAENVHRLLVHEGHLVDDAAQNAYALDLLTARLARAAWERTQALRAEDEASVLTSLRGSGKAAFDAVASGKTRLVGTNAYASADDTVGAYDADERPRLARPFEQARAAVEAARTAHGTPKIALLRFGDAAMSTARATFARGVLATLGLPVDETTAVEDAENARFVILCSSDDAYPTEGRALARTLASSCAGPTVFVAGPEDAVLRGSNVHGFVNARMPLLKAAQSLADAAFDAHGTHGACAI